MRKTQDKMDGIVPEVIDLTSKDREGEEAIGDVLGSPFLNLGVSDELEVTLGMHVLGLLMLTQILDSSEAASLEEIVRADLGGHLKYSRRWSGVRAGVLLGAQGAVRRGESRGGL